MGQLTRIVRAVAGNHRNGARVTTPCAGHRRLALELLERRELLSVSPTLETDQIRVQYWTPDEKVREEIRSLVSGAVVDQTFDPNYFGGRTAAYEVLAIPKQVSPDKALEILLGQPLIASAHVYTAPAELPPSQPPPKYPGDKYVPNRFSIQYRKTVQENERAEIRGLAGGRVVSANPSRVGDGEWADGGTEIIELANEASVDEAIARLKNDAAVKSVQRIPVWHGGFAANDPEYTNNHQWNLQGNDEPAGGNVFGSQAGEAWKGGFTGSANVIVAVIDTGFQILHPDLEANIWTNPYDVADGIDNDGNGTIDDVRGWDCVNGDNDVYDNDPVLATHGTAVASVAGAVGNNSQGIAGVNWQVRVLPLKAGVGQSDIDGNAAVNALYYLFDLKTLHPSLNIVAVNLSFYGYTPYAPIRDAMLAAKSAGILSVCIAGNEGTNNDLIPVYPSNYSTLPPMGPYLPYDYNTVITVTSLDGSGNRPSDANYGPNSVHLGAPGVAIPVAVPVSGYAIVSGTSVAAPHVSGAIALYAAKHPGTSAAQTRWALLNSARGTFTASMDNVTVTEGRLNVPTLITAGSIGVVDPQHNVYFRNATWTGSADGTLNLPAADPSRRIIFSGDWDGDGIDETGEYDKDLSVFYLHYSNSSSAVDRQFGFGIPGAGWLPIAGDWDNNGYDTVGLYAPSSSVFYLDNNNGGNAEIVYGFGPAGGGWLPLAGDWDNVNGACIGLYNPWNSYFYLENNYATPVYGDIVFGFGAPGAGWKPLAGDWDNDFDDSVGLYAPATGRFYLRNQLTTGVHDYTLGFGAPNAGWTPLAGDWDGPGGYLPIVQELTASAIHESTIVSQGLLSEADLRPIVDEAIRRWLATDIGVADLLGRVEVTLADLPGNCLGMATPGRISIDRDAAGHGWFVDRTPDDDAEFTGLSAISDRKAGRRMDLLTVVAHELGHSLGLADMPGTGDHLMEGVLRPGVRRVVKAG